MPSRNKRVKSSCTHITRSPLSATVLEDFSSGGTVQPYSPDFKRQYGDAPPTTFQEDFQKEITWCVEQLRMGMFTKSPTKKQVQQSERVIKVLTSSKAPLVKKRQTMQQTFGDYRTKIAVEENKWYEATLKQMEAIKISSSFPNALAKSRYIRPACSLSGVSVNDSTAIYCPDRLVVHNHVENPDNTTTRTACVSGNTKGEEFENSFQFNFKVDEL